MGVVTVYLDKIQNLRDSDGFGKSDPYVRFELEQDNIVFDKNYGKKVSSKKRNELHPVYGETFTFEDVPSLKNLVLHVKVKDDDIGLDDTVGSCKIDLEKMKDGCIEVEKVIDQKKGEGWFSKKATIYLKVSYAE